MNESFVDDLARRLAEPMPRRGAMRVLGGALAVTAFGGLIPGRARASHCTYVTCPSLDNPNAHGCCPENTSCCPGPNSLDCCDPGEECRSGKCVDPCEAVVGCTDECCGRRGLGQCCGSLCCTPDQVCDKKRGICCPPEPNSCFVPERRCAERVEKDVQEYTVKYCDKTTRAGSPTSLGTDAVAELGCYTAAQTTVRYHGIQTPAGDVGGLDRCPKVRDNSKCRCQDQAAAASRSAMNTGVLGPFADDLGAGTAATSRTARAIRRRLRSSERRLARHGARVRRLSRATAYGYSQPALELELRAYQRDVVKLRKSIARIRPADRRGRAARKHTLAALDAIVANLGAFAAGVGTSDPSRALAAGRAGRAAAKRGKRSAARARKALGCGKSC